MSNLCLLRAPIKSAIFTVKRNAISKKEGLDESISGENGKQKSHFSQKRSTRPVVIIIHTAPTFRDS